MWFLSGILLKYNCITYNMYDKFKYISFLVRTNSFSLTFRFLKKKIKGGLWNHHAVCCLCIRLCPCIPTRSHCCLCVPLPLKFWGLWDLLALCLSLSYRCWATSSLCYCLWPPTNLVFCAVRVVSKERRQLVLPRTSCLDNDVGLNKN
jgi:hypothetical protein